MLAIGAALKQMTSQASTMGKSGKTVKKTIEVIEDGFNNRVWPWVRLADIATKIGSGSTPRGGETVYQTSGIPLIRSMNVHFGGIKYDGFVYLNELQASKLKSVTVQSHDVLLNITGASIGRVTTAPETLAGARVNQHVCIIRTAAELLPSFLAHFFESPSEQARIKNVQVGATRQALTKSMIENWEVPLPSLEEQKSVIEEIDKQFTRLEAGETALRRVQINLKRQRASTLIAGCEGRLVENESTQAKAENRSFENAEELLKRILIMRRTRKDVNKTLFPLDVSKLGPIPEGWTWATLEQIAERVTVGFVGSMKHEYVEDGVPFLRSQNVRENRFEPEGLLHISPEFHKRLSKSALQPGDLAIVRSGSVGVTCVIPDSLPVANCSDLVLVQRPLAFLPQYGAYYMNSLAKRYIAAGKVGIALVHFNTKSVASLPIPVPPMAEQKRIVAEVERRLSVLDELESIVHTNLQRTARLRRSILNKAFRNSDQLREKSRIPEQIKSHWLPQFLRVTKKGAAKSKVMKKSAIQTSPELVDIVKKEGGKIDPARLCLLAGFDEDVEVYFDLLRECRNKRLLKVPSGLKTTVSLARS